MNAFFNKFPISAKILSLAGILLLLMLLSVGYALFSMSKIGEELKGIAEKDIPMTKLLTLITEHQLEQAILFERVARYGGMLEIDTEAKQHFTHNIHEFEKLSKKVSEEILKGEALAAQILKDSQEAIMIEEFSHVEDVLKQIESQHQTYEDHAKTAFDMFAQGKIHRAMDYVEKMEHEEAVLAEKLMSLLMEMETFTEKAMQTAKDHEDSAITVLSFMSLIAFILGAVISMSIKSSVAAQLQYVIDRLKTIASGDLTDTIELNGNEVNKPIKEMQQQLSTMILTIRNITQQLAAAAEQTSGIVQQSQSNIQRQRTETDMVATAMNEMTATVQEISRNIADTAHAAINANTETSAGDQLVSQTGQAIQGLADEIVVSSKIINDVENESKTIGSVLDVIKGIAEQTNLLALNAAIEAARAGEQGRGFAVVADEVRTLAGRTQTATEEINDMINNLQEGSRKAVEAMNKSCSQAQSAVEQAKQAGHSIETIASSVDRIKSMSEDIASATEQQKVVSEEINTNIVSINETAVHSVSSSDQIAQANSDLTRMATELHNMIDKFKVA